MTRAVRWLLAIGVMLALTGCLEGRSFHISERLSITHPTHGAEIELPIEMTFQAVDVPEDAAGFALFIDLEPIAPGASLDDIEGAALALIHRLDVETRSIPVPAINRKASGPSSLADRHRLTIVFVDADGVRIGDDAASIDVTVGQVP